MPNQKPHVPAFSGFGAPFRVHGLCHGKNIYRLFEAVEQNGGNSDRIREYGFLQAL